MGKQARKLVLSKETLRNLDDQDLSAVVGGTGSVLCLVNTLLCNGGPAGGLGLPGLGQTAVCVLNTVVCVQL